MLKLALIWPEEFRWLLRPVDRAPSFLVHIFTFYHKMLQAHLNFCCPALDMIHIFQEPWFLFVTNGP